MESNIDPELLRKMVGKSALHMTLYYAPASKQKLDAAMLAAKSILDSAQHPKRNSKKKLQIKRVD